MSVIKPFIGILLLLAGFSLHAQHAWIEMNAYLDIKNIQVVDNVIYAQAPNAIFTYNIHSGEIEKISSIDGLTGEVISNFYYHSGLKKLFVFHEGGLIEVMDEQKNVSRSPALAFNTFIPADKKVVNKITARGNLLYLATDYGITIYNLENNEFGDTYYTAPGGGQEKIHAVNFMGSNIYAASSHGLIYADINSNLIDYNVWTKMANYYWTDLFVFNNKLMGIIDKNLFEIQGNQRTLVYTFNQNTLSAGTGDFINISLNDKIIQLTDTYMQHRVITNPLPQDHFVKALDFQDDVYIATQKNGILHYTSNTNNPETIHPNCPLYNHPFGLDVKDEKLWVVYGDYDVSYNPYPFFRYGISTYQDKQWVNIPYNQLNMTDISHVRINPSNTNEVYISSPNSGLGKLVNNQLVAHYDYHNSPMINIDPNHDSSRIYAMEFDSKNNLWLTHPTSPYLLILHPDASWTTADISTVFSSSSKLQGIDEMVIDDEDNIWLGTIQDGVVGYKPETGNAIKIKEGIADTGYTNITGLDIDKDGTMWMGNHQELLILNHPEKAFDGTNVSFKPIKIVYEGVVQLLMKGQSISKIKVDGSNNKWMGTMGSGAYYFNEDGTKLIYHFTKENSPLPSNDIYDIAIDGKTGIVYFATQNGLIAYKGIATEAGDNMDDVYAFPNPVNARNDNFVTIRGLLEDVSVKIVDVEGNLVYEAISKGGSISWDLTAFGRYKVASGVYIALITNDDGSITQTTKILIIR